MTRLGSLVTINPRQPRPEGPLSQISIADIDPRSATVAPRRLTGDGELSGARRIAVPGDILFARISPSMENGKVAIVPPIEGAALVSGELLVLRAEPEVDARQIWAFLRQRPLLETLRSYMTGTAGRRRLAPGVVEELELPQLPAASWQRAAQILAQLDRVAQLRSGALAQMRGVAPAAVSAAARRLPREELGDLVEVRAGSAERSARRGVTPLLGMRDLREGRIIATEPRYLPGNLAKPAPRLAGGELLIGRIGADPEAPIRVAVYEGEPAEASFGSNLIAVAPGGISPDLLWAWLGSEEAREAALAGATRGTGRFSLSLADLRGLPVPSFGERAGALGQMARAMRMALGSSSRQLELIEEAVQAHLAQVFAGTVVSPLRAPNEPSLELVPGALRAVFEAASREQQRIWLKAARSDSGFRVSELIDSEQERASLQHTLAILEGLGVLVCEREGVIDAWRAPDPENEVLG